MMQGGRSGLSQHAQELVVRSNQLATEAFDCDLLIVGSGYGGAVAAARAAGHAVVNDEKHRRPARVWVLERGTEYLPGAFPSRFSEIAGHVRFDMQDGRSARGVATGLFDVRLGSDVCTLLGNGLGGGSLINAGVMAIPDDEVFESGWPREITRAQLNDAYKAARHMLSPQPVPDDKECDKLRSFDEVAGRKVDRASVTVHWKAEPNPAGMKMQACTLCGDCLTGCNQSAKGSLDTNYLAWARARGVELFCGGTVSTLARDATDSFWEVRWHYTEPSLRPPDGKFFTVRAKRVVLAAGSLGSTEILMRSETSSLKFSPCLGGRFSINGGMIAAGARHQSRVHAVGDQESDPADDTSRHVGPTITGLLRVESETDENGQVNPGFVIEEFAVPAGLRNVYGEIVALLCTLSKDQQQIGGTDPFAVTDYEIERLSLYGLTGNDEAGGRLRLPQRSDNTRDGEGIRIDWKEAKTLPLFGRMQSWLGKQLRLHNAVLVPDTVPEISSRLPAMTVHPLSGCRMADNLESGVVDHSGCIFMQGGKVRHDLVILDGSIVPRALGVNPSLTIAALAERAMPMLLKKWEWESEIDEDIGVVPQRPPRRRRELPAQEVVWSIRERLQGRFSVDQQNFFWARMDIEFEQIPGFRRALALQSRVVAVRRAVLELYPANRDDDEFTIDDPSKTSSCRAELSGSIALFMPLPGATPDENDHRVTLNYQLSVQSVQQGDFQTPLTIGGRLDGLKVFGRDPGADASQQINPWRQLTEMRMRYDGIDAGRWVLDVEDLAQRRDPLLRMVRLSSMPDALDDLSAIALYVLRRTMVELLLAIFAQKDRRPKADHLSERWPSRIRDVEPHVTQMDAGARLTHYPTTPGKHLNQDLPPVLLIHGLGYSGASFTDASMPHSLAAAMMAAGRDIWVLDVRSSIGNECARHGDRFEKAKLWTVEGVAMSDVPQAVDKVFEAAGGTPIDVFAHCMGAMMFCLAALGDHDDKMKGKLRAVVLSQVGPLIRFSPLNRLRGYVASYLQQFLRIDTFDTTPNFVSKIDGDCRVTWCGPIDSDIGQTLVDALLSMFPYPDGDNEAARESGDFLRESDFRRIRHRGDAIFGQQFELVNISDEVLARLEVFTGWVMVPMLAQAIHFARRNMLTNAQGRNAVLHEANFKERFNFPLLIIHGRRNRVFNWRGSHDSWQLLNRLRTGTNDNRPPQRLSNNQGTIYGARSPTQLAVFDKYGHMDCIIGECAHQDIFGVVSEFFRDAQTPKFGLINPPTQFEAPWIGPMIGWIRPVGEPRQTQWWKVRLLVHPQLRRSKTQALVVVPMRVVADVSTPMIESARIVPWPPKVERDASFDLHFGAPYVNRIADTFSLFTMHQDLPLGPLLKAFAVDDDWLKEGFVLNEQAAFESWLNDPSNAAALTHGVFSLAPKVVSAADWCASDPEAKGICFALASCQYPPGLFDERPAAASYERLQADAMAHEGPQFLILCGDQVYVDETAGLFDPVAATSAGGVHDSALDRTYEMNWQLSPFRRTTARLPTYAMLDDHEVHDNWKGLNSGSNPPGEPVKRALAAFYRYQHLLNPARSMASQSDRSFCAYPGGMPLFVLDTRSQRSSRDALTIAQATIIPNDTMQALQTALCDAPEHSVKLIVSPSPIIPAERFDAAQLAERLRSDSWSGYPGSMVALLGFIRDNKIRRVVLLSGDAHLSCVCSFQFELNDNRVVSVISSGMYAPWPFANQRPDELALDCDVDLGLPELPVKGSMQLHAISTYNGYAVVDIRREGDRARLSVSFRSSNGATTDCVLELV